MYIVQFETMKKMSLDFEYFSSYRDALKFVFEFNNDAARMHDDYVAHIYNEPKINKDL